jgi:hypothetical protein
MKRIAIICFSDFTREPRVLRTIEALNKQYNVTLHSADKTIANIICDDISGLNIDQLDITFHHRFPSFIRSLIDFLLNFLLNYKFQSLGYFRRKYWSNERLQLLKKITDANYDLIIGHGIYTLPILAKSKTKTVFNAHEYYLKEFEESSNWMHFTQPYYKYVLDTYLEKIDLMFCVSERIQLEYQKQYQIRSIVFTNATAYKELLPNEVNGKIKMIHHGGAIRSRQLEIMGELMQHLDSKYELTFMLTPTDVAYLKELQLQFKDNSNIIFKEPVEVNHISEICNQYDIGLFILPPVNFNWFNALPNKLFEFIQGRLCVAVSPNPDMKRIVEEHQLGVVADDYTALSMAAKIRSLYSRNIMEFKNNSDNCAKLLNAENSQEKILQEINKMLN